MKKCLVVENQLEQRKYLIHQLKTTTSELHFREADTIKKAASVLKHEKIDIVLFNTNMDNQEEMGFENWLCKKHRQAASPIVLVTGDHIDYHNRFSAAIGGINFAVKQDDISYFEYRNRKLIIGIPGKEIVYKRIQLKQLMQVLDGHFIRVHQSFVVNSHHISALDAAGTYLYLAEKKEPIPIGPRYRAAFMIKYRQTKYLRCLP